jgi:hypothetical protein
MTTWTEIANGDVDQDSPVTQELVTALRDNPKAIAEGSEDAPKVQGAGVNLLVRSTGSLVHNETKEFTNLSREQRFLALGTLNATGQGASSSTGSVRYRASTDGGATWGSYTTFVSTSGTGDEPSTINVVEEIDLSGEYDAIEISVTRSGGGLSVTTAEITLLTIGGVIDP